MGAWSEDTFGINMRVLLLVPLLALLFPWGLSHFRTGGVYCSSGIGFIALGFHSGSVVVPWSTEPVPFSWGGSIDRYDDSGTLEPFPGHPSVVDTLFGTYFFGEIEDSSGFKILAFPILLLFLSWILLIACLSRKSKRTDPEDSQA